MKRGFRRLPFARWGGGGSRSLGPEPTDGKAQRPMPEAAVRTPGQPSLRARLRRPPSRWQRACESLIERFLAVSGFVSIGAIALIFLFVYKEGIKAFSDVPSAREFVVATAENYIFDPETEEFETVLSEGYIWQPIDEDPKVSFVPLLWGSFYVALMAAVFSTVVGMACGIFLSELCSRKWRERLKPVMEVLVGVPTVVIGFFMLVVIAVPIRNLIHSIFGESAGAFYPSTLNAFIGAIGVSVVIIPVIASLIDDALRAIPNDLREGSLALGSTRWQTTWRVVVPAAHSGVLAAIILGFGRALGETMIVLMCAGNAPQLMANPFASTTTMTARIAAEMGAAQVGSLHQHTLFLVGGLLVTLTFVLNLVAELIIHRFRRKAGG